MSRTYKDKDFYLRFPEEKYDFGREDAVGYREVVRTMWEYDPIADTFNTIEVPQHYIGYRWLDVKGVKTKKPRNYEGDWKWWRRTPSWFVRDFMTGPKRRACRDWEKKVVLAEDVEDFEDCPDFGKKPHVYYY